MMEKTQWVVRLCKEGFDTSKPYTLTLDVYPCVLTRFFLRLKRRALVIERGGRTNISNIIWFKHVWLQLKWPVIYKDSYFVEIHR